MLTLKTGDTINGMGLVAPSKLAFYYIAIGAIPKSTYLDVVSVDNVANTITLASLPSDIVVATSRINARIFIPTGSLGESAHIEGEFSYATGKTDHAEGSGTIATGNYSHAEGQGSQALAVGSHSEGISTITYGTYCHTEGSATIADGGSSHAEGLNTKAIGGTFIGKVISYDATAKTVTLDTVTGLNSYDYVYVITTSTAGSPIRDTIISIDSVNKVVTLKATVNFSNAIYLVNSVFDNTANHAEGFNTASFNKYSHAEGSNTIAYGQSSHAEGSSTLASGNNSHAEGYATTANTYASHVMGLFNKALVGSGTSYTSTADAFVIGNGTGSTTLGNAFRVTFDGKTYGLSAFNSTGADYAEYFEWEDGNNDNEDRVGFLVTLDGEKIRKANSSDDYILGIISVNPSVIGDSHQDDWSGKHITDEWGRIQYHYVDVPEKTDKIIYPAEYDENGEMVKDEWTETVVIEPARQDYVPILNPNWDSTIEYTPREKRKEWSAVGMMGKLLVRQDGTCQVNGYCGPNDEGIATKTDKGYRVMKVISDEIVLVLVK
ncbi:hypothetical protein D3C86_1167120 [compost metagenome]